MANNNNNGNNVRVTKIFEQTEIEKFQQQQQNV